MRRYVAVCMSLLLIVVSSVLPGRALAQAGPVINTMRIPGTATFVPLTAGGLAAVAVSAGRVASVVGAAITVGQVGYWLLQGVNGSNQNLVLAGSSQTAAQLGGVAQSPVAPSYAAPGNTTQYPLPHWLVWYSTDLRPSIGYFYAGGGPAAIQAACPVVGNHDCQGGPDNWNGLGGDGVRRYYGHQNWGCVWGGSQSGENCINASACPSGEARSGGTTYDCKPIPPSCPSGTSFDASDSLCHYPVGVPYPAVRPDGSNPNLITCSQLSTPGCTGWTPDPDPIGKPAYTWKAPDPLNPNLQQSITIKPNAQNGWDVTTRTANPHDASKTDVETISTNGSGEVTSSTKATVDGDPVANTQQGTQAPPVTVGSPLQLPTDYARENTLKQVRDRMCGGTGQPPCKIDDTGIPENPNFDTQKSAFDTQVTAHTTAVEGVAGSAKKTDLGFSWSLQFPTGSCETWEIGPLAHQVVIDPCPKLALARTVIAWIWAMLSALYIWRSFTAAKHGT